ncbi:hypothetical protein N7454_000675 [Penicillium verhagenii]|nr:hypothetical protein N7454_000675 [Penicillium verhagenii]
MAKDDGMQFQQAFSRFRNEQKIGGDQKSMDAVFDDDTFKQKDQKIPYRLDLKIVMAFKSLDITSARQEGLAGLKTSTEGVPYQQNM